MRAAAIGAAAGAATGALIGHAIQEDRARAYGPVPPGGWPLARYTDTPGVFRSPYTGRRYDLRGVPPGGLTRDIDTGQLFRRPYRRLLLIVSVVSGVNLNRPWAAAVDL